MEELVKKIVKLKENFEKSGNQQDAKTISETLIMIDNLSYDATMYKQWHEESVRITDKKLQE